MVRSLGLFSEAFAKGCWFSPWPFLLHPTPQWYFLDFGLKWRELTQWVPCIVISLRENKLMPKHFNQSRCATLDLGLWCKIMGYSNNEVLYNRYVMFAEIEYWVMWPGIQHGVLLGCHLELFLKGLIKWLSTEIDFPNKEFLAIPGNTFDGHPLGDAICIQWVETRNASTHLTMIAPDPSSPKKGLSDSKC